MTVVDEVRAERQDLATVLSSPKYTGLRRRLVDDLYPDRAHFVFELLQNAEDAGATRAKFTLHPDRLEFAHEGGRPFEKRDIYGITNFGESTKDEEEGKIGQFGIGFKAVFAYTETPHIYSGPFAFCITNLVLPTEGVPPRDVGEATFFLFPFDNPRKPPEVAYEEISRGLRDLSDATLLFLRNITAIEWTDSDGSTQVLERIERPRHHIEIVTTENGTIVKRNPYLRFSTPVEGLPQHTVAIVFALNDDTGQERIVAEPGRVSVYFPAEKETSNLRFHVHAPFVPELSRASIKKTAANDPLYAALAGLAAAALPEIRDLGLLTRDFLAVLPNLKDTIPSPYQPIREAILSAMRDDPLTPTYAGGHASAKNLLQARATLKDLLNEDDLATLLGPEQPWGWAIAAQRNNSEQDRFLESLGIRGWDVAEFAQVISGGTHVHAGDERLQWLGTKSEEWHQRLYAVLYEDPSVSFRWTSSRIVRLTTAEYAIPSRCYFPEENATETMVGPRVDPLVYSSGKSAKQQEDARAFLEEIGVHELGEAEEIVQILSDRYAAPIQDLDDETHLADVRRFMTFSASSPQTNVGFSTHRIFRTESGVWATPAEVYLDAPYRQTFLSAFFVSGMSSARTQISTRYAETGIEKDTFAAFAERVGTQTRLKTKRVSCYGNPARQYLVDLPGQRYCTIDQDWTIEGLEQRVQQPTLELSRLIWRTMGQLPDEQLQASFRRAQRWGTKTKDSQLVHILRNAAWVAQADGRFVKPAEASRALLPTGFPFDEGERWLKSVEFGKHEAAATQDQQQEREWAERNGFSDAEQLERARRFAAIPPEMQQQFLFDWDRRTVELPTRESPNPARRAENVRSAATEAQPRMTVVVSRSVPVGRDEVKHAADSYLRHQYTNSDDIMVCQMCKGELPFRKLDGEYFFEAVPFLPSLNALHQQNYLALCANHSAMFSYALAEEERIALTPRFIESAGLEFTVFVAGMQRSIYFTQVHRDDLLAVVDAEQST